MNELYSVILRECEKRGIKIGNMCDQIGIRKSLMSDLKSGRKTGLSTETLKKVAAFFGVSVDYLVSDDNEKNAPAETGRSISDRELKFALWGTTDITDEVLEDVRRFAKFAEEQEKLGEKRKDDKRPE